MQDKAVFISLRMLRNNRGTGIPFLPPISFLMNIPPAAFSLFPPVSLGLPVAAAFLGFAVHALASPPVEIVRDTHFQGGFVLLDPKPGKAVPRGELGGIEAGKRPVWKLAQWASKYPLENKPQLLPDHAVKYANEGKTVVLAPEANDASDLCLAVNGQVEYGSHVRKFGENWVHLLVEQNIQDKRPLDQISKMPFHFEARLNRFKRYAMPSYSPDLHAAQFQIFFTIQNINKASPEYGNYLWFGIPIYDDRNRSPEAYTAQDAGKDDATNKFIYIPARKVFASQSMLERQWIVLDKDILPLLKDGLASAWQKGYLKGSTLLSDYAVSSINMGWEITGTFDVEMQVRNFSLQAEGL